MKDWKIWGIEVQIMRISILNLKLDILISSSTIYHVGISHLDHIEEY